jgi:predicted DNA-binding transcriptional regulator AlpA
MPGLWSISVSGNSRHRFITLQELCEQLGISRSRYHQLQKQGIFPAPQRTSSSRPVFDNTLAQQCLDVVRTRVGINGEPVLFNAKRKQEPTKKRATLVKGKYDGLVAALASLGLPATPQQVSLALAQLPNHGDDLDEPSLIRAVFLEVKKAGG